MFTFLFPKPQRHGRDIRQHFQNANPYPFRQAQLENQMKANQAMMMQYTMFNALMQHSQLGQNGNQWATHEQLLAQGAANARQNQMQGWNPSAFTGPSGQQNLQQRVNEAQSSYQEGFGRRDVPAQAPASRRQPRLPSGMMVAPQQNNPYFIQAPYVYAAPQPMMTPQQANDAYWNRSFAPQSAPATSAYRPDGAPAVEHVPGTVQSVSIPQQTKKRADEVRQQTDERMKKIAQDVYAPTFTQSPTPPYTGAPPVVPPTVPDRTPAPPTAYETRNAELRKYVVALYESLQTSPNFTRFTVELDTVATVNNIIFRSGTRYLTLRLQRIGGRLETGSAETSAGNYPVPDTLRATDLATIGQLVETYFGPAQNEAGRKRELERKQKIDLDQAERDRAAKEKAANDLKKQAEQDKKAAVPPEIQNPPSFPQPLPADPQENLPFVSNAPDLRSGVDALMIALRAARGFEDYLIERDSVFPTSNIKFSKNGVHISVQCYRAANGSLNILNVYHGSHGPRPIADDLRLVTIANVRYVVSQYFKHAYAEETRKKEDEQNRKNQAAQAWFEGSLAGVQLPRGISYTVTQRHVRLSRHPESITHDYSTLTDAEAAVRFASDVETFVGWADVQATQRLDKLIPTLVLPPNFTIQRSGTTLTLSYQGMWTAELRTGRELDNDAIRIQLEWLTEAMPKRIDAALKLFREMMEKIALPQGVSIASVNGTNVTFRYSNHTQEFRYQKFFYQSYAHHFHWNIEIDRSLFSWTRQNLSDFTTEVTQQNNKKAERESRIKNQVLRAQSFAGSLLRHIQRDIPITVTSSADNPEMTAIITIGQPGAADSIRLEHTSAEIDGTRFSYISAPGASFGRDSQIADCRNYIRSRHPEWLVYEISEALEKKSKELFDYLRKALPWRILVVQRITDENTVTISVGPSVDAPIRIQIRPDFVSVSGESGYRGSGEGASIVEFIRHNRVPWLHPGNEPSLTYQEQERRWREVEAKESARSEKEFKQWEAQREGQAKEYKLKLESIEKERQRLIRELPDGIRKLLPGATVTVQPAPNPDYVSILIEHEGFRWNTSFNKEFNGDRLEVYITGSIRPPPTPANIVAGFRLHQQNWQVLPNDLIYEQLVKDVQNTDRTKGVMAERLQANEKECARLLQVLPAELQALLPGAVITIENNPRYHPGLTVVVVQGTRRRTMQIFRDRYDEHLMVSQFGAPALPASAANVVACFRREGPEGMTIAQQAARDKSSAAERDRLKRELPGSLRTLLPAGATVTVTDDFAHDCGVQLSVVQGNRTRSLWVNRDMYDEHPTVSVYPFVSRRPATPENIILCLNHWLSQEWVEKAREEVMQREIARMEAELPVTLRDRMPNADIRIERRPGSTARWITIVEAGFTHSIPLYTGTNLPVDGDGAGRLTIRIPHRAAANVWLSQQVLLSADTVMASLRSAAGLVVQNVPTRLHPGGRYVIGCRRDAGSINDMVIPARINGQTIPGEQTSDPVGQYGNETGVRGEWSGNGIMVRRGYDNHFNTALIVTVAPNAPLQNISLELGWGVFATRIERRIEAGNAAPPPVIDEFNRLAPDIRRGLILEHSFEDGRHLVSVNIEPLLIPDVPALKQLEALLRTSGTQPRAGDARRRLEITDIKLFTEMLQKQIRQWQSTNTDV